MQRVFSRKRAYNTMELGSEDSYVRNDSCYCFSDEDSLTGGNEIPKPMPRCDDCEPIRRQSQMDQLCLYQRAMWHWFKFNEYLSKFYNAHYSCYSLANADYRCQCNNMDESPGESGDDYDRIDVKSRRTDQDLNEWNQKVVSGDTVDKRNHDRGNKKDQYDLHDNNFFQMELNEDFKRFLEISSKHREEREKLKQHSSAKRKQNENHRKRKDKEKNESADYIYYDASKKPFQPTTNAPVFVDKRKMYKERYGPHFEKILNLEAELQLDFEKFCDEEKPSYWPCIPLKF